MASVILFRLNEQINWPTIRCLYIDHVRIYNLKRVLISPTCLEYFFALPTTGFFFSVTGVSEGERNNCKWVFLRYTGNRYVNSVILRFYRRKNVKNRIQEPRIRARRPKENRYSNFSQFCHWLIIITNVIFDI